MMIAIAYIRVSTDKQENGPTVQRAAIEAWAKRTGTEVRAWHDDNGKSGGLDVAGRPGLAAAIEAVVALGPGTVLIVAKRDRLARDVVVALGIERVLAQTGGRIVSADGAPVFAGDPRDDPMGWLLTRLNDILPEYERHLIGHRTIAALQNRKARGLTAGHAPWGYVVQTDGKLATNETEARITLAACELRMTGLSWQAVAQTLNARGCRTRSGNLFDPSRVMRICRPLNRYGRTTRARR